MRETPLHAIVCHPSIFMIHFHLTRLSLHTREMISWTGLSFNEPRLRDQRPALVTILLLLTFFRYFLFNLSIPCSLTHFPSDTQDLQIWASRSTTLAVYNHSLPCIGVPPSRCSTQQSLRLLKLFTRIFHLFLHILSFRLKNTRLGPHSGKKI